VEKKNKAKQVHALVSCTCGSLLVYSTFCYACISEVEVKHQVHIKSFNNELQL